MRVPADKTMQLVMMLTHEYAYYLQVHNTLKRSGFRTGHFLPTAKGHLELALALARVERRRTYR